MTKIFIESKPYHDETLFLLIEKFSDEGDKVLVNKSLQKSELLKKPKVNIDLYSTVRLFRCIINLKPTHVYINTIEDPRLFVSVLFLILYRTPFSFIIHNGDAFYNIRSWKEITKKKLFFRCLMAPLYNRFGKDKFVLSESVKSYMAKQNINLNLLSGTYFKKLVAHNDNDSIDNSAIYITLVGTVDYKRRNYDDLLEIDIDLIREKGIKVVLLGNINKVDGPNFLMRINQKELANAFVIFDEYIPYSEYFLWIKRSHYLISRHKNGYGTIKTSATEIIGNSFGSHFVIEDDNGYTLSDHRFETINDILKSI